MILLIPTFQIAWITGVSHHTWLEMAHIIVPLGKTLSRIPEIESYLLVCSQGTHNWELNSGLLMPKAPVLNHCGRSSLKRTETYRGSFPPGGNIRSSSQMEGSRPF
jgi:hypothetical protein